MFKKAAEYGNVIIALNSDRWVRRKKNFCFYPWIERQELLLACRYVSAVVSVFDDDGTVSRALYQYNPTIFGNGGDRTSKNTPEKIVCAELGIEMLWGLGGGKVRGSTPSFEEAALELYGDGLKELYG